MASANAQEPIKIGFSVSLTGGLASSGKAHPLSQQIWMEEINANGGLLGRPIKLNQSLAKEAGVDPPGFYQPPFAYAAMQVLRMPI